MLLGVSMARGGRRSPSLHLKFGNGDKNTGKQANPANTGGGTAVSTSSGQSGVMKRKDLSNIPLSEQVSGSRTPDEAQKEKAVANETVTNVTIPLTATTIARYEPQSVTNTNVVANTTTHGLALNYIPPEIINRESVVKLVKEEVDREILKWQSSLIAYIIGETPGYNVMKRYITQFWNMAAELEVCYHEEGYYVISMFYMTGGQSSTMLV
ncbi:hypothetical protein RND71_009875 [Anisodus tanguticus]|uniref:DUF4283 domain-containing protein n=1 Tax=Anisodus tanguticus TaxID=243964 RepID=A0AAE1SIL6_9SOLA|nr:hypothetical protein RND71_009875 [Anisodus tanguticus]